MTIWGKKGVKGNGVLINVALSLPPVANVVKSTYLLDSLQVSLNH